VRRGNPGTTRFIPVAEDLNLPDPFISQQDLTDYLGIDVTNDDGALIALDAACDMCRIIAEQDFNAATSTVAFDGTGTDAIILPYTPVTAAGTVTVSGSAITDYMLAGNGMLFRGTAGVYPRPTWPSGRQNVRVTFDHGYQPADLPRDVRIVALSVASRLMVQGVATEETVGDVRVKYAGAATDLTNTEQMVLRKYRSTR